MSNAQNIVRVDSASVATVEVTLKALKIGKKQMTQSVFRQLMDESPMDLDKMALRGTIWGQVNYYWKDCHVNDYGSSRHDHVHIVWQLGGELRRAGVDKESGIGPSRHTGSIKRAIGRYGAFEEALNQQKLELIVNGPMLKIGPWTVKITDVEYYSLQDFYQENNKEVQRDSREELEGYCASYLKKFDECRNEGESIIDMWHRFNDLEKDLKNRWEQLYDKLINSEQLFIAV